VAGSLQAVAKSIREFGFGQPIVVDKDGVIVVGHTRYKAALKLGLATVPVHVAADLSPQQARAYRLADNRTAETAEWDVDLLPIELGELRGDGRELCRSEPFRWDSAPRPLDVDISGVKVLRLEVTNKSTWHCAASSIDWADLRLEK